MAKKILEGIIVQDNSEKTVSVLVKRTKMHNKYKKFITKSSKYQAHDPENLFKKGDKVKIKESKPLSKTKKWVVIQKIEAVLR